MMKLNWFSPLPPQPTDIAHFTERVLNALGEKAEVVLWTDQSRVDARIKRDFEVRRFNARRVDWEILNRADGTFYNIGNDPRFHAAIWEVSRRHPGVVILHDLSLQHFFGGVFLQQWRDPKGYVRAMGECYGEDGRRAALKYIDHEDKDAYILHLSARYPLTEMAARGALAVVLHTQNAYEDLRLRLPCVCAYAPLPYPTPPHRAATRQPVRTEDDIRRLIVFGYLGPNRRLESLFDALAAMPEKNRFRLDVYGRLWDAARVRDACRRASLSSIVKLHGYVAEEELEAALARSDLAINLRFPTMGEASGSQLRIWAHALPSIVTAADWYATLPPEAVAHVRIEHEREDIQRCLRELLNDPARFDSMGEVGRRVLEEQHSPREYVAALVRLVEGLPAIRSRAAAFQMTRRAAHEVACWSNAKADGAASLVTTRIANRLHEMFGEEGSSGVSQPEGIDSR